MLRFSFSVYVLDHINIDPFIIRGIIYQYYCRAPNPGKSSELCFTQFSSLSPELKVDLLSFLRLSRAWGVRLDRSGIRTGFPGRTRSRRRRAHSQTCLDYDNTAQATQRHKYILKIKYKRSMKYFFLFRVT